MADIDTFKQCMHLSGSDGRGTGVSGDPARRIGERPGLQPFQAQPEPTILPDQRLQLSPIPRQEHEAVARIGILPEFLRHHGR